MHYDETENIHSFPIDESIEDDAPSSMAQETEKAESNVDDNTAAAAIPTVSDQQAPKKRGRKSKAEKAGLSDNAEIPVMIVSSADGNPKKPGRPKGSKNTKSLPEKAKVGKAAKSSAAKAKAEKPAKSLTEKVKAGKPAKSSTKKIKTEKPVKSLTEKANAKKTPKSASENVKAGKNIKLIVSEPPEVSIETVIPVVPVKRGRKPKASTENISASIAPIAAVADTVPADSAVSTEGTKLADQLGYKVTNAWEDKNLQRKQVFDFSDNYMSFLNKAKTEREFVKEAVILAERKGFRNLDALAEDMRLVPGDKIYRVVKNKLIMMAVIGANPMVEGVRILGAHVDSPRIDIKQNPLYESNEMAFLKTHYYGGIKKYQWTAIPVAIHGVFVKTDGTTVNVLVGEDEKDPIFTITDLLPHLAKDQYEKKLGDAIAGESMNLLLGSEPYLGEESKEKVKLNTLRLLSEMYGIKEEDFLSAELEVVPAFKARDLGLDRSMIGAYGHDDKVCAYPAMMAVLEAEDPKTTSLCILTDKEEIGSVGNTGAESRAMENFLADLCAMSSVAPYSDRMLRKCLDNSKMLSADVTAAVDPNFEGTHDKLNASYLGKGIAIMKYSGSRGKSGASDAHAEYVAEVRKILNDAGIAWQTTELGAVDKGGGGTIAMMIANLGVDVIDCGVPVLSMHAPFEVVSKVDLFNTYMAYIAFLK